MHATWRFDALICYLAVRYGIRTPTSHELAVMSVQLEAVFGRDSLNAAETAKVNGLPVFDAEYRKQAIETVLAKKDFSPSGEEGTGSQATALFKVMRGLLVEGDERRTEDLAGIFAAIVINLAPKLVAVA